MAVLVVRMKGDTPVNSTMSVGQARKLVEQLKIEASFCRIKVRQSTVCLSGVNEVFSLMTLNKKHKQHKYLCNTHKFYKCKH